MYYESPSNIDFDLERKMEQMLRQKRKKMKKQLPVLSGPVFGSTSDRFGIVSSHPQMWIPVTNSYYRKKFTNTRSGLQLSPASYNVRRIWEKAENDHLDCRRGWARQAFLQDLSKLPSIVKRDLFESRKEVQRVMGPGKYDICREDKKPGSTKALMDSRCPRFGRDHTLQFCTPGPGSYGIGGIPGRQLAVNHKFCKSTYWEKSRCDRSLVTEGSGLAPGTYSFEDPVKKLISTSVGKRGPFDLFTAERDAPLKTGHRPHALSFLQPKSEYETRKGIVETLMEPYHRKKGVFSKLTQYPGHSGERIDCTVLPVPMQNATRPGPADYDITGDSARRLAEEKTLQRIKAMRQKVPHYGFMRSSRRNFTFQRVSSKNPGPGRYKIPRIFVVPKVQINVDQKLKSVRSRQIPHNVLRERLRTKNVGLQDRINFLFAHL